MKNNCVVKISNNSRLNIIKKLVNNKIYYENLRENNGCIYILVDLKYLKEIKRVFKKKNVHVIKFFGIYKYKLLFKSRYITILAILIALSIIFLLSNIIFEIKIETSNNNIKKLLTYELKEHGIEKYKFKKSYKTLTDIKKDIIKNNKDKLEWIEIEVSGTKYTVKVNERKLTEEKKKLEPRSLVSKKDAVIKKITADNGVLLKEVNDYVKKGEVIISGNVVKGEDELKGTTAASGKVYGEVWYLVNTVVPFKHREYVKTDNEFNNYYIEIFGKKMNLINYYNLKEYRKSNKKKLEKFYLPFKMYKETVTEYKYVTYDLTIQEAYKKGIKKSEEKIKEKLSKDEYIISKKVLKKENFSSKIVLEIFFKVYEDITSYSELESIKKGSES